MKIRYFALLILILSLPLQANAKQILDIQEVTSPGGIKAWLVEDHSVPVIAMQFAFRGAGSVNDPADKQGLAQLLSNTMDEGAGKITSEDFQKELQNLSIDLGFGASRDDFNGSLKTLTANKDRAFELTRLALTAPRFDAEPVKRMKEANQSRILSSLNDPDWIAARILNDVAFQNHPYAHNSGGTLSSLEKIMPADLRAFDKSYFGKNNLIVSVAGDITKADLAAAMDKIFSTLPSVKLPAKPAIVTLQNQGQTTLFKLPIPQSIIEIVQPGIDRKDPDYQKAQIMNFILGSSGFGSHLTREIREKRGLTYGIYTSFMDMDYFDGLNLSTSTDSKNVPEMISLIKVEWDKMKTQDITAKELADAKSYLIGALPLSMTSTDDIAALLLSVQADDLPKNYFDLREQALKDTTIENVRAIAEKLLDTSKMTTIIVGGASDIQGAKILDKIPDAE